MRARFSSSELWSNKKMFFVIFIGAVLLRLIFLSQGPIFGDEPAYSVRSISLMDTLFSNDQKTPFDLLKSHPWWLNLSFHDHPPLTFWIRYIFLSFFGVSLFVVRLPSALFDMGTAILIFFIGKKLWSERIGLLAMGFYAVTPVALIFARSSMMESITLFFILLTFYIFIKSLEKPTLLPWFGAALGLSFLAKYVALVMLPVYVIFLLIVKREYFKNPRLYVALFFALLVFSPVIIYNTQFYRTFGHFDVQFASILGQETPEWKILLGKAERGDLLARITGISILVHSVSPLFLLVAFGGIFLHYWQLRKRKAQSLEILPFLALLAFLVFTWLSGSAVRFIYYCIPFFILYAAFFLCRIRWSLGKGVLVSLYFVYEVLFSVNSVFLPIFKNAIGPRFLAHAPALLVRDNAIIRLDNYLTRQVRLEINVLILYDPRIEAKTFLWILGRQILYGKNNVAIRAVTDFSELTNAPQEIIYLHTLSDLVRKKGSTEYTLLVSKFVQGLEKIGIRPAIIYNHHHEDMFSVYTLPAPVL